MNFFFVNCQFICSFFHCGCNCFLISQYEDFILMVLTGFCYLVNIFPGCLLFSIVCDSWYSEVLNVYDFLPL